MEGAPSEVSGEKHTGALQQTVNAMAAHIDKLQIAQAQGAGCPPPPQCTLFSHLLLIICYSKHSTHGRLKPPMSLQGEDLSASS